MLTVYRRLGDHLGKDGDAPPFPDDAVWMDCMNPTREDDEAVEAFIGVGLPTREEMQEIEPSSRLSTEHGALYLTAAILCNAETSDPHTTPITFVLTRSHLATVRYDEPGMLPIAISRLQRPGGMVDGAAGVLVILLEAAIDRVADVIERTGERIEKIARRVFDISPEGARRPTDDHRLTLRDVGHEGMRLGHIAESLISLSRLLLYLTEKAEAAGLARDDKARVHTMLRDVDALRDHIHALEDRTNFLLDATLGLISIQQNDIIKIFSVLAVVFLPPTLVASLYGMNFALMPELQWTFGYPFALLLMVGSAVGTYAFFRWRNWL